MENPVDLQRLGSMISSSLGWVISWQYVVTKRSEIAASTNDCEATSTTAGEVDAVIGALGQYVSRCCGLCGQATTVEQ